MLLEVTAEEGRGSPRKGRPIIAGGVPATGGAVDGSMVIGDGRCGPVAIRAAGILAGVRGAQTRFTATREIRSRSLRVCCSMPAGRGGRAAAN